MQNQSYGKIEQVNPTYEDILQDYVCALCLCVRMCVCVCIRICRYMYTYMHTYRYLCIYVHVYIHVWGHVEVCVRTYTTYMYTYTYAYYTYTYWQREEKKKLLLATLDFLRWFPQLTMTYGSDLAAETSRGEGMKRKP